MSQSLWRTAYRFCVTYDFCMFSKFVSVVPIYRKIGTHIDWNYDMYIAKTYINKSKVTYASMATKYPIIKNRAFFKTLTAAISPINTWRIHMKPRMEIPGRRAYFVWQPIEHRSKVKIIKNIKITVWAITFAAMTYDVPFLHHVTNKTRLLHVFLNSSILHRLI